MEMNKLTSLYGSYTFNDEVMRERIPNSTYKAFHESLKKGETLSKECATVIANAMKPMHDRSNGLGGGFAAYGIYPEYKDFYALHFFF